MKLQDGETMITTTRTMQMTSQTRNLVVGAIPEGITTTTMVPEIGDVQESNRKTTMIVVGILRETSKITTALVVETGETLETRIATITPALVAETGETLETRKATTLALEAGEVVGISRIITILGLAVGAILGIKTKMPRTVNATITIPAGSRSQTSIKDRGSQSTVRRAIITIQ
jgi:hypothetical protein